MICSNSTTLRGMLSMYFMAILFTLTSILRGNKTSFSSLLLLNRPITTPFTAEIFSNIGSWSTRREVALNATSRSRDVELKLRKVTVLPVAMASSRAAN